MGLADLGPRVIGIDAYRREQAVKAAASDVLGPKIVGPRKAPAAAAPPVLDGPDPLEQMPVVEIESVLGEAPVALDRLVALEEQRPAPRVRALKAFDLAEAQRDGGARPGMMDRLAALRARL